MTIHKGIAALLALAFCLAAADDRMADRQAIRADIDGIYQAFIHKDREKVKATSSALT